jgi:hypothetical protein
MLNNRITIFTNPQQAGPAGLRQRVAAIGKTTPAHGASIKGASMARVTEVAPAEGLSFFERYLTLWVVLCIAAGILLQIAPGTAALLDGLASMGRCPGGGCRSLRLLILRDVSHHGEN